MTTIRYFHVWAGNQSNACIFEWNTESLRDNGTFWVVCDLSFWSHCSGCACVPLRIRRRQADFWIWCMRFFMTFWECGCNGLLFYLDGSNFYGGNLSVHECKLATEKANKIKRGTRNIEFQFAFCSHYNDLTRFTALCTTKIPKEPSPTGFKTKIG